ncbi:MAG: acetylglutamate kinase [Elusimicrobiota bacterium]
MKNRKKLTVIKFGGSLSKNPPARKKFIAELAALVKKEAVVLVHGGGPEINIWLEKLGIASRFVKGFRFTDQATLEVVEMVLSGKVNKEFVAGLLKQGVHACGISGKDAGLVVCKRLPQYGFVGEPVKVRTKLIDTLLSAGYLPVLSSLGCDAAGTTLNVNADSLAMAVAVALHASRLILLTDVPGVLDEHGCTIPLIHTCEIPGLLRRKVVTGGMIPKIKACAASVRRGVREVIIADGAGSLKQLNGTIIK